MGEEFFGAFSRWQQVVLFDVYTLTMLQYGQFQL